MGIQGLIPLLKPIQKATHLSSLSGLTVGVGKLNNAILYSIDFDSKNN
jgi:hypothetical protein